MLKIRPLNRDSLSDEDAPTIRKEAQEEIALDLYNNALRLQCNGKLEESQLILQQLIDENIPQLESQGGLPKTMSTLKYSCYVNLAGSKEKVDLKLSLEYYLLASELDKTDVTLWYKIGNIALKLDKFRQAALAFSQGLECNEAHWPCLDQLIIVLFSIRDTIGCLYYITKALMLNPNYTRGLVLRKKIYESNSGTRDYYKLTNPDYVFEPDLDVPIAANDMEFYMEAVERLCDRINEAERAISLQKLPCIPLPTPLEDFTWLALGRTLVDLHRYISDNKMSHFCTVDLTKCMSQTAIVEPEPLTTIDVVEKEVVAEPELETAKAIEIPDSIERRMSLTSDNADSGVENFNSSQAEDNDEMDQDTEDQEDADLKNDKKKGTKRRRDLLLDLQVWGWHSKRKSAKKGKSEKDFTVEDALKRIIPSNLLPRGLKVEKYSGSGNEDSMSTIDIYKMFMEKQTTVACLSPIHSPSTCDFREEYFGSQREKDDVLKFWAKPWICCDAVSLIEEFVHILASFWDRKWPLKLVPIYIDAFKMYREHFEHPPLHAVNTVSFDEFKNNALATLLYGELFLYQTVKDDINGEGLRQMSLGFLQMVSAWDDKWADDHPLFFIRVYWLRAHIFRKSADNVLAIRSLQLVHEMILSREQTSQKKFKLFFPNCGKFSFITSEITEKLLKHLEMIDSLSRLEELYNLSSYGEVAEILQATFICVGNAPTFGRIGRPAQMGMLMDSLWYTNRRECFVWTEKCMDEAVGHFVKPLHDGDKWQMVLEKALLILQEIIKEETVSVVDLLMEEQRSRLIENLCRVVCHQLNNDTASLLLGLVTPWIVLHHILLREEHREQAQKVVSHIRKKHKTTTGSVNMDDSTEKDLPPSIAVLFSAHEFLGRKGWCLTSQGELLHFIIDKILDRLDTPIFESLREKIDIHIEQAFFCLYQHPSKKNKISRHLADHNVNPLPLKWERAQQLFEYFCPDALPEFDSYKSISITSDLEQLLQRIIALVPTESDPQPLVAKASDFVQGNVNDLPDPIAFPHKVSAVYYLLGDYYFKQNEIGRSVKYFLLDLCINPTRLDTWADLALGYASQLENKLNHCERFKSENDFLEKAKSARVCFQRSLAIMPDHVTLWIEFGAFEYTAHAFCSRLLKYESDTFSMDKFEVLENQKESYLDSSGNSFTKALDLYQPEQTEADERWLHHYMLGKVAEKRRKEPVEYLQHYLTAAVLLNENNAQYPDKINYHNPQQLSVEALEIHYRLHASILKYLELHEGKNILNSVGKMFKKCLDTSKLYGTQPEKKDKAVAKDDFGEIVKCVEDLLTEVEKKELETNATDVELKKEKPVMIESKVRVRDVQELMDDLMKETMAKETTLVDTDSDAGDDAKQTDAVVVVDYAKKPDEIRKSVEETTTATTSTSSDSSSSESDSEDTSSSSASTASSDVGTGGLYLSDSEMHNLVDRCILGLEQCISRFPQNYKALYRLVHLFFHYKARKDVSKCKQLLLSEYKCKNGAIVTGLFSDHKANNFFNGVWRIPSSEIDRPGSLSAHMNRCVTILLQILRTNNDHKMLLDVCLQLKRTPDADKIYIRHADREQLAEQALSLCIQALKTQIKNGGSASFMQKLLLDVFRALQRIQKHASQKESVFAALLTDAYKKFMLDKIPENVNVLDLAVKFCQQHKAAEKLKQQQQKQTVATPLPLPPAVSRPPVVLPTPTNVSLLTQTQPLKRPTLGRPRGRPPGPKHQGSPRSARGRSPMQNSWQNMMYDQNAMSYMLKYQEDLLRQYNALSQMNFGQFSLPSTSLLPSNQLLQSFNTLAATNQLTQSLSQLNPSVLKKLVDQTVGKTRTPDEIVKQMMKDVVTKTTTSKESKPLYTTAGFTNKNLPSSSFQYTNPEVKAKAQEDKKLKQAKDDYVKAASMLTSRPSITITPVTQTKPPFTVGKTLQQKLADKQKQHSISSGEKGKSQPKSKNFHTPVSSSIPHANVPTFPLDSGVSISQLAAHSKANAASSDIQVRGLGSAITTTAVSKQKNSASTYSLPPNMPISVSVIKKTDDKKDSSDDDVIIIE